MSLVSVFVDYGGCKLCKSGSDWRRDSMGVRSLDAGWGKDVVSGQGNM